MHMVNCNCNWEKHSQPYPVTNTHVTFAFSGVGKNWAGPFFPHPDKVKQQPCSEGYLVGEYCRAYGNRLQKSTANLTLS